MPRRKRVTGQNERRRKVRRRENNDDDEEDDENTLVISDSESDEEDEDRAMTLTSRTARRLERDKKAHVQDMTEDEMLDLALRLSKQEANCASQREQVEDDDMRKAIAESLQVSCSQSSETSLKRTRSAAKPRQDRDAVAPAHARCKLSFPGPNEKGGALKRPEDNGPLPPMPDLSQRTPSPPSPTLPSVPSAASQESRCSLPAEEESNDEAPLSDSPLGRSPVFLRHCSVRVNPLNASEPSPDASPAPRSSLGFSESQNSPPPPPKSPVFPKTDSKRCTKSTRGKFSGCTPSSPSPSSSSSTFTGGVCKPDGACRESSSHKRSVGGRALKSDVSPAADGRSLDDFTSHMVLHLSDEDDDGEENDEIVPPSPVFPQGRSSCAGQPSLSPTQPCPSPRDPKRTESLPPGASAGPGFPPAPEGNGLGVVSYYWGVPFCPKGQSPDDYTRVILAQLEVYEKSLKEAQRKLLHKADWGVPVFPRPLEKPRGRRLKRHRAPRLLEEEEEEDEDQEEGKREGEEPNQEEKERKGQAERTEREASQPRSEKGAENEERETYVVVSSPETQELPGKSPSRFERESTTTAKGSRRKPLSRDLSEETRIYPEPDEGGEEDRSGRPDAESAACPETQMTDDNTPELMVTSPAQLQADADVMEVDEASEPAAEADEGMEQERPGEEQPQGHSVSSQVECPMCTRLFPLSKVEMHAAYCNGSVEEQEQHQEQQENLSQGSARRRSVRRTAAEDDVRFDKSAQQEKCYVCNKFFTRTEYSHHVDQCLQQIRTHGTKQENGLLSALNRTETVHLDDGEAGPSNATVRNNRNLTHSSVTADGSAESPGYYVSSSPIKSFTPISELKDCFIDFRQQFPDRTGPRLGRKRKFKR